MTTAQIFLIIYLCSFICSMGGLWLIDLEAAKTLRKMGYTQNYSTAPFDLSSILLCLCPILNALVALVIVYYWDNILKNTIKVLTKGKRNNE